jgi:hypothetical protein
MTPMAVLAVHAHAGGMRLWGKFQCWHGLHDWTNARKRGEPPTPEQLERGPEGFVEYMHTTCTRCPRVRPLSWQTKVDIGIATPADYVAEIASMRQQALSGWRWHILMLALNLSRALPNLIDVSPLALINMAAAGMCWHGMRRDGKQYQMLKKMHAGNK